MIRKLYLSGLVSLALAFPLIGKESIKNISSAEAGIQKSLNKFCIECHDDVLEEGDIRLDNFSALEDSLKAELLSRVEQQLYVEEMPPKDEKVQPTKSERSQWLSTIQAWNDLTQTNSMFRAKLQSPEFGNYLDHDKLFSGQYKDLKGFTYERDWMISEFIFNEKMAELLKLENKKIVDGKREEFKGGMLPDEVANPFRLPEKSGVRYYANQKLSSSHAISMIGNSQYVADAMIGYLSWKYPDYLPAVAKVARLRNEHDLTINKRKKYLDFYIDQLCQDLYKQNNDALLPVYTPIKLEGEINLNGKRYGKHGWGGKVGKQNVHFVNAALYRSMEKGKDKMAIIRDAERYLFHLGLKEEAVGNILTFFMKEISSLLIDGKTKTGLQQYSKVYGAKLSDTEISAVKATIKKVRKKGMSYQEIIEACAQIWQEEFQKVRKESNSLDGSLSNNIVNQLFEKIFDRSPSQAEREKNVARLRDYAAKLGVEEAIRKLTQTFLLKSEFITRSEYGVGEADQYSRKELSPRDMSIAIAYALTDSVPDAALKKAVSEDRLNTRPDIEREVKRMLKDRSQYYIIDNKINFTPGVSNFTNLPIRKLRFFREFFGYNNALKVFKDRPRFNADLETSRPRLIAEADMLVEHILEKDKNVFEELLTTEDFYVFHSGDNKSVKDISERVSEAYYYFKKHNWLKFKDLNDVKKHEEFLTTHGLPGFDHKSLNVKVSNSGSKNNDKQNEEKNKKKNKKNRKGKNIKAENKGAAHAAFVKFVNLMGELEVRFEGKNKYVPPFVKVKFINISTPNRMYSSHKEAAIKGREVANFFNINPMRWDYPPVQPAKVANRKGILTHPAWLQAFSQNTHTDPVHRGKWVREKLLAGTVPDVPIGVDAVIPDLDPKKPTTLRERLASVTEVKECWRCHKYMNPLGNAFEIYDDFGRYQTEEPIEHPDHVREVVRPPRMVIVHPDQGVQGRMGHAPVPITYYKTLPVNAKGELEGTGNKNLDGKVKDAIDMIERMAKAKRVRQSIIRHAFRYFLGRNEMLSDSKTLIDADEAYVKSGGSFDAVIVSLLTSDSFIYRKEPKE